MEHFYLLLGAGLLAGAMNAAAGGGTFITLPALVLAGVPAVSANESSTVALVPAILASAWAYRRDFKGFDGVRMSAMAGASLAGGASGALLLLFTSQHAFDSIIPWLMLAGSLAFAFGRPLGGFLRPLVRIGPTTLVSVQFVLATYGGYFGGGVGILMLAAWSLFGNVDIRSLNAARTIFVGMLNVVAVVCFVFWGRIWWPQTLILLLFATMGGYFGARALRRLPADKLRLGMVFFNFAMTIVFFIRATR